MEIRSYESGVELLARAREFLEQDEVANGILLSVCASVVARPEGGGSPPYLATVDENAAVIAAAIRTPPHHLLLSSAPEAALDVLALDLARACASAGRQPPLSGVVGPPAAAEGFAHRYARLTSVEPRVAMRHRTFELTAITRAARCQGDLRLATNADLDLLVEWSEAFLREAGLPASDRAFAERAAISRRAATGSQFVFCVGGRPVSMATAAGRTAHGKRIGFVYTPPELRDHAYASACVATLSQRALDEGLRFVTLNADAANPTSNSIYRAIGFRPAGESFMISFEHPVAPGTTKRS